MLLPLRHLIFGLFCKDKYEKPSLYKKKHFYTGESFTKAKYEPRRGSQLLYIFFYVPKIFLIFLPV